MRATAALVVVLALLTGACSQVEGVVTEATERASEALQTARYCAEAVQLAGAVEDRDVDAAITHGEALVDVAPDEIVDDVQLLLAAAREARNGNMAALQSDEVRQAAERVQAYTRDTCDPT